jgi:hypothetical protein
MPQGEHKLYGKLSKCSFFQKEIQYLGHTISGEGIVVDRSKIETIIDWFLLKILKKYATLWDWWLL